MTRGESLENTGDLGASDAALREALAVLAPVRSPGSRPAQVHDLMGIELKQGGHEREAEAAYREAIRLYRALPDRGGVLLGYPLSNLGVLLGEQGRYAESATLSAEALAIGRRYLPLDHPDVLSFELDEGGVLMNQHLPAQAEPLLRHVVEARRRVLGPEHKDTLDAAVQLVDCLAELTRYGEATRLGRPAAEALERQLGPDHPVTLYAWSTYGTAACQTDQVAEGLAAVRRVEAARVRLYGPDDWHPASTRVAVGACLAASGHPQEAEAALVSAAQGLERTRGPGFHRTQAAYQALRDLCARLGRADEAARWGAKLTPAR